MSSITLALGTTVQSPAAWGAHGLALVLRSLSADTLEFDLAEDFDATLPCAVGTAVALEVDGVVRFRGRVDRLTPSGNGRAERVQVSCIGPWSHLERIVYTQGWQVGNGTDGTLSGISLSRVVIGQGDDAVKRTIGAEITAAVACAVANGAVLQAGTIDVPVTIPYSELVDVTCAELIRTVLRWVPDVLSWIDYTTAVPTLHVRRRADFASVEYAVTALESVSLQPRADMVAAGVVLNFESAYQYNGASIRQVSTQTAGSTTGEGVVRATIQLEGAGVTVEEQRVRTRAIVAGNVSWWSVHVPWLGAYPIADLEIESGSDAIEEWDPDLEAWFSTMFPPVAYLAEGSLSEWMGETTVRIRVSAKISYTGTDEDLEPLAGKLVAIELMGTSASSKTYRRTTSWWAGEEAPAGLAAAMYAAMSVLHYQGAVGLKGIDCDWAWRPGLLCHLTGGRAEWATMGAVVQSVSHWLDTGQTRADLGPPETLSPQQFAEWLRGNRTARASWRLVERISGQAGGQSSVTGGEVQPVKDHGATPGGGGARQKTAALTVAGSVPTTAEISTALAAAYTTDTPRPNDVITLTVGGVQKFGYTVVTGGVGSGLFARSFVVGSTTYYATGWQLGLY